MPASRSPLMLLVLLAAATIAPAQVTVFRNVTLIDGNGGPPRHHVSLVIEAGKIRSVLNENAKIPAGLRQAGLS